MKIAFLVYDSRSGSTFLSREIADAFDQVLVTPEIGFDKLFALGDEGLLRCGWASVLQKMYHGHELLNFGIPYEEALELLRSSGEQPGVVDGVHILLEEYVRRQNRENVKWLILKNGSHIKYWKKMKKLFGDDLVLLHVVRDPRAVINSKLRTKRPYHQDEVMAWGGVIPAAFRWRMYVNSFYEASVKGVRTHELKYEDLVCNLQDSLMGISSFLGVPLNGTKGNYKVPDSEQLIHKLVLEKGINDTRTAAWITELQKNDCCRIEALCKKEMARLCYGVTIYGSGCKAVLLVLSEVPNAVIKIFKHAFLLLREPSVGSITKDR